MQKALRETQTLRAGCSKAEPKKNLPTADPFPGARDGQNLSRWSLYLYLQTHFGEDRCTQFRVIVVTDRQTYTHKPTHKHTHRQDRLQYTAPQLAIKARSVNIGLWYSQRRRTGMGTDSREWDDLVRKV